MATIVPRLRRNPAAYTNLWRHEVALRGSFLRTFHELQRLQAKRAGEQVSAPAVVDVDINVGQS